MSWLRLMTTAWCAALCAAPAWGACTDTYPDSQVTQKLAKEAYAVCTLETMETDYAGILKEQARLLGSLRTAYDRALLKDTALAKKRLGEFDEQLKELSSMADQIVNSAKAAGKAGKNKGGPDGQATKKFLQDGRDASELLRTRIRDARESLEAGEQDSYCKLDFHFRWGERLAGLIKKCK